jgi:hypothetical protein
MALTGNKPNYSLNDMIGTSINDRGTLYNIRDQEAFDTANAAKSLAEENQSKIEDLTKPLVFDTYAEFPNIGEDDKLYIDINANKIYRWDSSTYAYIMVSGEGGTIDFDTIQNYI